MSEATVSRAETKAVWPHSAILRALATRDTDLRSLASSLVSDAPVTQIAAALDGASDSDIKRLVAEILGRKGGTSAVPALIRALSDEDTTVRYSAADAIGKVYLQNRSE